MRSFTLLAASDPLVHVMDAPIGDHLLPGFLEDVTHFLYTIGIGKNTLMMCLAAVLTVFFFKSYIKSTKGRDVPGRWGNFVEIVLEFLRDQMIRPFMGAAGDKFLPLVATFFVFILTCNLLGLIPFFDLIGHGGNTATAHFGITLGLGICSFFLYHIIGTREQGKGFWHYFKGLFPHVPLPVYLIIIPVELIAHFVRLFALAIRLAANMSAGHILLAVFLGFTGTLTAGNLLIGAPVTLISVLGMFALTFLELLVAIIQAFVFTFLTTVFLSMAVHPDH